MLLAFNTSDQPVELPLPPVGAGVTLQTGTAGRPARFGRWPAPVDRSVWRSGCTGDRITPSHRFAFTMPRKTCPSPAPAALRRRNPQTAGTAPAAVPETGRVDAATLTWRMRRPRRSVRGARHASHRHCAGGACCCPAQPRSNCSTCWVGGCAGRARRESVVHRRGAAPAQLFEYRLRIRWTDAEGRVLEPVGGRRCLPSFALIRDTDLYPSWPRERTTGPMSGWARIRRSTRAPAVPLRGLAPSARRVSVVGSFNQWDGCRHLTPPP